MKYLGNYSRVASKHAHSEEDTADIGTTRRKQSIQTQNSLQDEPTVVHRLVVPAILALAIIIGMHVLLEGVRNSVLVISGRYVVKHVAQIYQTKDESEVTG